MHGIGAHSALAIKRQRRRRERAENARRKAGNRPRQTDAARQQQMSNKVMGTITMGTVGAVFLTVGLFLMLAALITNETNKAEIAELIGTGVICLAIGLFLVILNRFYGQREEEELQNYVESRLARSRSGQRLYHETDSIPDHLDDQLGEEESRTPSMSSETNVGAPKKKKKGIQGPSSSARSHASVSIINERSNNHSTRGREDPHQQQQQQQQIEAIGLDRTYVDDPAGLSRANHYRVYNSTTA